ncbi:hypothetical protein [Algoriphagus sp. A40]|uniref:hypothetical protein n=1 Tax=Algoriphagus sp. A40 TaxID=1945863 RepID=UPI000984D2CA|nr:hypothetical protein [Algoriphagus sp. A40]OOG70762.1 hypothetical protein B0E43_18390 [Algoriphagus sp. A40]
MKKFLLLGIGYLLTLGFVNAQVFSNKPVGEKQKRVIDSVKMAEYPYALPILGDKAAGAGFELPYSAGVSAQYFWQQSDIIIENIMVGFNNGQMYDVDEIIRFNKAVATASAVTVRPDIWLFPFLNIYGILGKSQASTEIGFGLWLPDGENNFTEVLSAGSLVEFNATTFGLGMTPTIGIGGGFMALDMNVAWTDVPQLAKPAKTFIFGPRFGKNFKMPNQKAVTVWVGGFRVHLSSETYGSIPLSEVFPEGSLGGRIDEGIEKVESAQIKVDTWWDGLSPVDQNNPINKAKYNKANDVLERASNILVAADGAISTIESSTVQYSMDKRPADMWNFIIGGQYQFSKHFMVRAEYGFLGSREQLITGVQYRFGL